MDNFGILARSLSNGNDRRKGRTSQDGLNCDARRLVAAGAAKTVDQLAERHAERNVTLKSSGHSRAHQTY